MNQLNPYQPPETPLAKPAGPVGKVPRSPLWVHVAVTIVILLNLIIPLLFAWSMTRHSGRVGMFAAIVLLMLFAHFRSFRSRRFGLALTVGGLAVALTQILPLLHILVGMVAFLINGLVQIVVFGDQRGGINNDVAGFIVTALTGLFLGAIAVVAGLLFQSVTPLRWWQPAGADDFSAAGDDLVAGPE